MAMRDKDWWTATLTEVAANLDALVRRTPYNHLVRNASTTGSVRLFCGFSCMHAVARADCLAC